MTRLETNTTIRALERVEDVLSGKRFDLVHVVSGYLLGAPIIEVPDGLACR